MHNLSMLLTSLQVATASARERLDDPSISTRVKQGNFQVVRVTFDPKGKSTITPITAWATLPAIIDALYAL